MEKRKKTYGDDPLPLFLLPDDILIQKILVYLPVKTLIRFKSVCKSWLQLIHSPFFINLHTFNSSTSSKFGHTFILQTREPSDKYEDNIKLFMLSSESTDGDDGQKKMVFKVEDLKFLPIYMDYLLTESLCMVGSCNGIICLHDPELLDMSKGVSKHHYKNLRDVSLWNPATRQFRILPKSIPIEEKKQQDYTSRCYEDYIAFGFDVETKDYKVLRITPYRSWRDAPPFRRKEEEEEVTMCSVQVYSLSTDDWRLLEGINYMPVVPIQGMFFNRGIYLNGSYFFVGEKSNNDLMMFSFDFTKETFTTVQFPDNCNRHKLVLSCLGDKIAVFTTTTSIRTCDVYEYYDIWVLNEHGSRRVVNKKSWTKLHSFPIKRESYSQPRCISNNGEFALISTGTRHFDGGLRNIKLQLFNLITKEAIKDLTIGSWNCRAEIYKESLVSIMGGGNLLLKWQLPIQGATYKINLDAPFSDPYFTFGIGLCLTSDTGACIGVRGLKRFVRDAEEGDALAILEAIKWAKELELYPITIESDSNVSVFFFMDDDDDNKYNLTYWDRWTLSLLREAKLLLDSSEIGSISLKYCYRSSCNHVADVAAKLGREESWVCMDWTAKFPGEIVRSLNRDLGKLVSTYVRGYQN